MTMKHGITPSQTVGPFPHEAWAWAVGSGSGPVLIEGTMFDGSGACVDDGWVEAWTPSAADADADAPLPGFRRVATDANGRFRLAVPEPAAGEPAAWITVFARGLLLHRFTAVFVDAAGSPLLEQVPRERRATLVAQRTGDGTYRWDIRLQGDGETVFLDFE